MNLASQEVEPKAEHAKAVGMPDYVAHPASSFCPAVPDPKKRWHDIRYLLGDDAMLQGVSQEEFQRLYPGAWRNPLTLYRHAFHNGNPASKSLDRKLIFIHPQKAAGSTLTFILRANIPSIGFRNDFVGTRDISPELILQIFDELSPLDQSVEMIKWSSYDALAGHGVYGIHRLLNVPYEYMTILRHPVERFLSYYRFVRMQKHDMQREESELREHALRLSPLQFLYDSHFNAYLTTLQSYARIFSGYTHPNGKVSVAQQQCMYTIAHNMLAKFETILIAEAFDLSVALLQRKFQWQDALFRGAKLEFRNDRVGDRTKAAIDSDEISSFERGALEEFFHHDIDLYNQGSDMFIEDIRANGLEEQLPPKFATEKKFFALPQSLIQKSYDSHIPAGIHQTELGFVDFGSIWIQMAIHEGIDPLIVDTVARYTLRKEKKEGQALLFAMQDRLKASVELTQAWLQYYHSESAYLNVVERDCYGVCALHAAGFQPRTVVDIGAHVGMFSLLASSLWPESRIISVEAREPDRHEEHTLSVLRRNVEGRSGISVYRAAVIGMPDGIHQDSLLAPLCTDTVEHWLERGLRGDDRYKHAIAERGVSPVSFATLLERHDLHSIDLLKLSCDGAETNILLECKSLGMLDMIGHIRGRWYGERARKHLPEILSETHIVEMRCKEGDPEGFFFASPKNV